ncbi:MAG: hypothetical protein JO208_01380 [Alphaproteobacteria bacterium]|nr:hypothetical protein [Alphaproteobacteria bacterium]
MDFFSTSTGADLDAGVETVAAGVTGFWTGLDGTLSSAFFATGLATGLRFSSFTWVLADFFAGADLCVAFRAARALGLWAALPGLAVFFAGFATDVLLQ